MIYTEPILYIKLYKYIVSKQQYWSNYFENNKNNLKQTWNRIKNIVNIKNVVSSNSFHLKTNNTIIEDPKDVNNSFNNFFANVGPVIDKKYPKVGQISYILFAK